MFAMKPALRLAVVSSLFAAAIAIFGACETDAVSRETQTVPPVVSPNQVEVKPEQLAAVWETYRILKRDYVDQTRVDAAKLSEAAIRGLTSGEPISVQASTEAPSGVPKELLPIWDTFQKVVLAKGDVSPGYLQGLNESAINAMLDTLDDPYTSYISPGDMEHTREAIHGSFEGIGAVIGLRDDKFTIVAPMKDSPAQRAGIQPGDVILKVDDEAIAGPDGKAIKDASGAAISLNEVVLKIRGPRGTRVKLEIIHESSPLTPVQIEVVRDRIQLLSVSLQMRPDKIALIEVSSFTDSTGDEFETALKQAREQGAAGIILDMRNNPGGLLTTTVDVASQFLDGGLVLYEIDGKGERTEWKVRGAGLARSIPTIVLVNAASASGAEVAAGALQDRGRAKLVGVQTYGKGSVNFVRELESGGAIYVTHALWYTPNGNQINLKGLAPDVEVKLTQADVQAGIDAQLDKALEMLKETAAAGNAG